MAMRAMTAESIPKALGRCMTGADWMACYLAHDDRKPSLSVSPGNAGHVLVCCHAGCDQREVIAEPRSRGLALVLGNISTR